MHGTRRRRSSKPSARQVSKDDSPPHSEAGFLPRKSSATLKFNSDLVVVAIFTLLALGNRFYRISLPPAVVFDELHFSKFVDRVLTHTWFFDIHPPLGKLILAYTSYALGYRPDPEFVIEKIGNEYPAHMKYTIVRCVSAAFSVGTVPLTYLISRKLRISRIGSVVATSSVLLDFLGLIEGRLILMDSQLLFFCQLSLYFALHLWQTRRNTRSRVVWLFLTGVAAGAALSVKHTALATPGLIAVISFFGLQFLPYPLDLLECTYAGVCGLTVYVVSFYVMFNALWISGGKYDSFMPVHFKKTLIKNDAYDPAAKRVSFPKLFFYLNKRMVASNANIKKRHSWESDWYHWIVNWRGVLYYVKRETIDDEEVKSQIYLLGNPVVIYLALLSVVVFCFLLLLSIRYRKALSTRLSSPGLEWMRGNGIFLLSGWLCNLLPYILVDRAAFIYHYMPGLFYGQLLTGVVFDLMPAKVRVLAAMISVGCMVAAFVYWAPWVYALPLTAEQHQARRWLPKWT